MTSTCDDPMTHRPIYRLLPAVLALALALPLVPAAAAPEGNGAAKKKDPNLPPLPAGVVAEVAGRKLTFDGFCYSAAQQALADIRRQRSGPRQVLEQLIEELMVRQECKRLGIQVTQADVTGLMKQWDTRIRRDSNGEMNLRKAMKEEGTTEAEFVAMTWHVIRKERVAEHPQYLGKTLPKHEHTRLRQIGIVVKRVRDKTVVEYGIWTKEHVDSRTAPKKLPDGQVVTVGGVPITMMQMGRALVMRLPGGKVRDYLDKECKAALMNSEGIRISDKQVDEEVAHLERLWPLERELQKEEVWRTVAFKDRFETQFNMTPQDVKKSRFARGLLGLVRRQRATVTDKKIAEEFKKGQEGQYGAHMLVSDIQISFAQRKGLMADTGVRSRRDALKMAHGILKKHATGVPFEKITADLNNRRDPTVRARRIRLYKTQGDQILYAQAARLRRGDLSSPIETLSEVHVLRSEGPRPARTLEEVKPYVREVLSRNAARKWIQDRITDPKYVRIVWPLPERGVSPPK